VILDRLNKLYIKEEYIKMLSERTKKMIDDSKRDYDKDLFNQFILELLCSDINNQNNDEYRVEIIRYIAVQGYLY
jgi:hypothetical protein